LPNELASRPVSVPRSKRLLNPAAQGTEKTDRSFYNCLLKMRAAVQPAIRRMRSSAFIALPGRRSHWARYLVFGVSLTARNWNTTTAIAEVVRKNPNITGEPLVKRRNQNLTAETLVVSKNREAHRGDAEGSQRTQRKRRLSTGYSGRSVIRPGHRYHQSIFSHDR
jgi:hypothetical protein